MYSKTAKNNNILERREYYAYAGRPILFFIHLFPHLFPTQRQHQAASDTLQPYPHRFVAFVTLKLIQRAKLKHISLHKVVKSSQDISERRVVQCVVRGVCVYILWSSPFVLHSYISLCDFQTFQTCLWAVAVASVPFQSNKLRLRAAMVILLLEYQEDRFYFAVVVAYCSTYSIVSF